MPNGADSSQVVKPLKLQLKLVVGRLHVIRVVKNAIKSFLDKWFHDDELDPQQDFHKSLHFYTKTVVTARRAKRARLVAVKANCFEMPDVAGGF